jgi:pyruvate/2-oxoglutarate dehydrogenase complex dihydrolipoamide dehydrogenase (E3) component
VSLAPVLEALGRLDSGLKPGEMILDTAHVAHLKYLPRTMAVVGAGVIGIEYASMFATLGVQVTWSSGASGHC